VVNARQSFIGRYYYEEDRGQHKCTLILSIMLLSSVGAAYVIGKRKKMNEE